MKKMKKRMFGMLLCMLICLMCSAAAVQAASPENVMKAAKAPSGSLKKSGKKIRYYNKKTKKYIKNKWLNVKGSIYYFDKKGYAVIGWKTHNGKRYYFASNGKLTTGWKTVSGKKYYFWKGKENLAGSAAVGKVKISSNWYYFSKTGVMQIGWQKISGSYYYFNPSTGKMAKNTSIITNGTRYTVNKNGKRIASISLADEKVNCWVGDSRTVGLGAANGISSSCIAKVGAGYEWYVSTAEKKVKAFLTENPKATVVFNFGVNDHGNITKYIERYKSLMKLYPNARIYIMSVNPIDSKYTAGYVTDKQIKDFNKKMKAAFPTQYLDAYSYLKKNGFTTADGLHYTTDTYKKIYNYVISKM